MQFSKRKNRNKMLFLTLIVVSSVCGYWISISNNALGQDARVVSNKKGDGCDKTDDVHEKSLFDSSTTQWDEPKSVYEKWEVQKKTYVSSRNESQSREREKKKNCDFQNNNLADGEACAALDRVDRLGNHAEDVCLGSEDRDELDELTFIDENKNTFAVVLYLLVLASIRKTIKHRRNRREPSILLDSMR